MLISRAYDDLTPYLEKFRVLIILGARQVGKTTLVKNYIKKAPSKVKYDFGNNIRTQTLFNSLDFVRLKEYCEGYELIVIDEAQYIKNIGMAVKMLVDQTNNLRFILTGLSSMDLLSNVGEPLTGRKLTLELFPVSCIELARDHNRYELREKLEELLIYGSYPEVIVEERRNWKIEIIRKIVESYLLKDVLSLERVKSSKTLLDLLMLLALQLGKDASYHELATKLNVDVKTVKRYLELLEKSYVIFPLTPYSRNLREEINTKYKYYFYDTGIRNGIINNFNGLSERSDVGELFENFVIAERVKKLKYEREFSNIYFWRIYSGGEIDLVGERGGELLAFEITWDKAKKRPPHRFLETYRNSKFSVINRENFWDFILPPIRSGPI
jgi:predicted AAA+ superfamily ATPase